jgi:HD superfamily phosphohydrolase YqeK
LTAAISHDIVRAFETPEYLQRFEKMKNRFINSKYLKVHQNTSAKIIKDFLTNNNIDKKSITIITKLIEKHEVGGDVYQNILKDSDSLSFFETSNKRFINMVKDGKETEERVKLKFD